MRALFLALLLSCGLIPTPLVAATLTGVVRAHGKEGAEPEAGGGQYGSRKYKFAERVDYSSLRDFVVFIVGPVATNTPGTPAATGRAAPHRIDQRGAVFSPHILPVMAGEVVEWPNSDEIFHNAFSISDAKEFDLGLYKAPESKKVTFDKAGRVDVFCSIHKSMSCVVLVLENPFFATTDAAGRFAIPGVPPGKYKLKAWHERVPPQVREVVIPDGTAAAGEIAIDFSLGITGLPQP